MKKLMMLVLGGVLLALPLMADTETVDGYTWMYQINGDTVTISAISPASGAVTIPSTLGGKPVTSIGNYAFYNCSGLTSMTIPDSVTSIGEGAFYECVKLTSVMLGNGVTNVGERAFKHCSELTSVVIPSSVMHIGAMAFGECYSMTDVHVTDIDAWCRIDFEGYPFSAVYNLYLNGSLLTDLTVSSLVTSIGNYTFACCSITNVTIPDSVTSIGEFAFSCCSSLASVTIPNSITSVPNYAFLNCTNLTSVTIGVGVTNIGSSAFEYCSGLTSVTIPNSVMNIEASAFHWCTNLTSMTIPNSVTNIAPYAFEGCNGIKSVTVPQYVLDRGMSGIFPSYQSITNVAYSGVVTNIGDGAFYYCRSLTSVTIPDGVTSIGRDAFSVCTNLTSVTIPNSVTNIGDCGFSYSGLTSVTIPNSVRRIGGRAFYDCNGLTNVMMRGDCPALGASGYDFECFDGVASGCIVRLPRGNETYAVADGWWQGMKVEYYWVEFSINNGHLVAVELHGDTDVVIPNDVTSIGDEAFEDCSGLTGVTIPNSVTNIGYAVFRNCSSLTSVMIPNGVMRIGACAFENCSGLTNVNLSSCWRLTDIESSAFASCTNLNEIAIPYSVERIGRYAFDHCNVLFDTNSIPGVILVDGWAVGYTGEEFTTVAESGYSYKELDLSGVRGIADGAFEGCPQLRYQDYTWTIVKFGDYIRRIGASAFADCDYANINLSGVHIGSIGESAFSGCYVSVSDYFANIDAIEDGAFRGSYGLEDDKGFVVVKGVLHDYHRRDSTYYGNYDVEIPDDVARIGPYALSSSAQYISRITIPDSVASIAHDAFHDLRVERISIGKGVAIIEDTAFVNNFGYGCAAEFITVDAENPYFKTEDGLLKTKDGSQIICAFAPSFGEAVGMHGAWTTGGDAEWGAWDCAQSGAIDDGQESWLEVPVSGTGVISFRWKASSEAYRDEVYDFATFSVDGIEVVQIGGETGWTNVTHLVVGNGPHVIRWTYKKDDDGSDGGDCVWLDNVQYMRKVCVSFSGGNEAEGNPPEPMIADLGAGIVLPGAASLVREKHAFAGWRIGETVWPAGAEFAPGDEDVVLSAVWNAKRVATPVISVAERFGGESTTVTMTCETSGASIYYTLDGTEPTTGGMPYEAPFDITETAIINAIAVKDDWFDSETVSVKSIRIPESLSGCLNSSGLVFRTGGAAEWTVCLDESHDGEASARSGSIEDGQVSWIETEVTGAGTVSFWWKVSSEASKKKIYDRLRFTVDGEPVQDVYDIGGNIDWTNVTCVIETLGKHVLRWGYEKDEQNKMGEDCAWLDAVTWTPADGLATWLAERSLTAETKAANGRTAAECYALGLDPEDDSPTNDFRIVSIEMVDGKPQVEWEPKVNRWTGAELNAVLKGAERLEGPWTEVSAEDGSPETARPTMRFFKVEVELP